MTQTTYNVYLQHITYIIKQCFHSSINNASPIAFHALKLSRYMVPRAIKTDTNISIRVKVMKNVEIIKRKLRKKKLQSNIKHIHDKQHSMIAQNHEIFIPQFQGKILHQFD